MSEINSLRPSAARITRRRALGWIAAVFPASQSLPFLNRAFAALGDLDAPMVRALATAVLPSELGANGLRSAADAFLLWTRDYKPDMEQSHPYGSARITRSGADPTARWALQLVSLESDARRAHSQAFTAITDDQRRAIVRAQLANAGNASLGNIASAQHVAIALLSHFFSSSTANDLAYESQVGRNLCRPLSQSGQRPVPLQRRAGGASPLDSRFRGNDETTTTLDSRWSLPRAETRGGNDETTTTLDSRFRGNDGQ